ncbi:MAG: hypothetical protein ACREMZ_12920 [Gemmatimonadales bacterium]
MAELPQEIKDKISEAMRRCHQSPTYKKKHAEGTQRSWTPARRAAMSRERREFWRKWREEGRRQKPRSDAAAEKAEQSNAQA